MWTFDNFPSARMQAQMGWAPDQAWLDRAMGAAARLPGCSASIVSARGLVLTNHHCVISCVQALSDDQADYLRDGFTARSPAEERRCPNLNVSVLAGIADVTERIDAAAADAPSFARARDAEIARVEDECSTASIRCEVVTLYQGGRYALYRYRRYGDVRLVFAPEHAVAAFGGEADNFNFPRFGADFAFLRVYANGAPAATPNHLSMRFTPIEEGEIAMAVGNPGSTSRLRTSAELVFERDVNLPWRLTMLSAQIERLRAFARQGAREARIVASALQTVENSHTALAGRLQALRNPAGLDRVAAREADLQTRVRRNRAAQRETGDAWGEIARAQAAYRSFFLDHQLLEARAGERSELFALARDIVRGAAEREKPDESRLPRYSEARIGAVAVGVRANRAIDPEVEAISLAVWLSAVEQRFPQQSAIGQRVFGGESPDVLARRLASSRLADQAYRAALWAGGEEAVAASDDPLIAFVRAWDEDARGLRARFIERVEAPVALAQERIARARFRAFGAAQYPDATFSPRISYGRVEGWTEAGNTVAPFTSVAGFFMRAGPDAPSSWREAGLNEQTQFNFTSSNDVIAGNSGGPLIDRDGRVIGVVFDGNLHSLGGEYFYDGATSRAISVSGALMREVLLKAYAMDALVAELGARR